MKFNHFHKLNQYANSIAEQGKLSKTQQLLSAERGLVRIKEWFSNFVVTHLGKVTVWLTILRRRGSKDEQSLCRLSTFKASTITLHIDWTVQSLMWTHKTETENLHREH